MSAVQIQNKLYKKFKQSGLENDKDNLKSLKWTWEDDTEEKKKTYFKEELGKNRNKPKELWKVLKALGLSSDKAKKLNISFKEDGAIQFEALENANTFKSFYSELAGGLQAKLPGHPTNLLVKQPKTTRLRAHAIYPMTLNFQAYLKKLLKRFYLVKPL